MLYVFLIIIMMILLAGTGLWRVLSLFIDATFDVYALLSFETLHLHEVMERIRNSKSKNLKRYFSSKVFRNMVRDKLKRELGEDVDPELLDEEMLRYLLESMRDTKEVELTSDVCTLEWLDANKHRLFMLSAEEIERMFKVAREVETAPPHTNQPDCIQMKNILLFTTWYEDHASRLKEIPITELRHWARVALEIGAMPESFENPQCERCKRELQLDVVTFVRKLPRGKKRKRRVLQKKFFPAFLHP